MRLLVFRHGIAEDRSSDGTDASRELTGHGVARTRAAARGLAAFADRPDVILSSPKTRALQTAREAAAAFGSEVEVLAELADGPPAEALRALAARTEGTVMIVGHEPMLSELVEQVCTGDRRRGFVDMRKAGCACLDVAFEPGGEATAATLLWLATPKMLRGVAPG
jgi:phosphohistidine phosphatase